MGWRKTTLTILDGQTESGELDLTAAGARRLKNLTFFNPAHGVTVTVHVAPDPGGTYQALNDGFGNDYTLVASKAQILAGLSFGALKLVASVAVTGDQVFTIRGAVQI